MMIISLSIQDEWKSLSEQQLQRIREKHADEISSFDQSEKDLRNKIVSYPPYRIDVKRTENAHR